MSDLKKIIPIEPTLELRLLEKEHAAELFKLTIENKDHLRTWLPWVDKNTEQKHTENFIDFALDLFSKKQGAHYGIFCPQLVGVIGYHKLDWANQKTEIGYWLGKSFQGKGLMTKACQALIQYAFIELGLNRVQIACATHNHKSSAIPQRLGFQLEGTLKEVEWVNDHFVDHHVFGILKGEY